VKFCGVQNLFAEFKFSQNCRLLYFNAKLAIFVVDFANKLHILSRMGCPSLAAHQLTSTNQKTLLFDPMNLSLMHFIKNIQVLMKPLCSKNFKTNDNMVPFGDHGTERVKTMFSKAKLSTFIPK
jgi:hypothetical protein